MADCLHGDEILSVFVAIEDIMDDFDDIFQYDDILLLISAISNKENIEKVQLFAEEKVPNMSDEEFRKNFRISRTVYNRLNELIKDSITKKNGGRVPVSPEKQLLVFLWYISNQDSIREIAVMFDLSLSTVYCCIHTVSEAITENSHHFITWPDLARMREISRSFEATSRIPNIVGVLDGTHIKLVNPIGGERDYINRKGWPSIQLQLVVDDKLLITDAFVGWPGATHDARVLRNSPLFDKAIANQLFTQNYIIIADSAYPLKQWLMTPVRDNGHLTAQKRRYNKAFSGARQTVERAIGHLKGRFRRLRDIYCSNVRRICNLIMSACVLHNLCILTDDDIDAFINLDEAQEINNYRNIFGDADNGVRRRNALINIF